MGNSGRLGGRTYCECDDDANKVVDRCSVASVTVIPLMGTGDYSATSNNMKLVHLPLMGGLLHLVQQGGDWAGPQPAQAPPRCTKCITAHPSTASVPITVLLYDGPLLCGFNVPIKALNAIFCH